MRCLGLSAQEPSHTSTFLIHPDRLTAFGESTYFSLNPGHEVRLTGRVDGMETELVLLATNEDSSVVIEAGGIRREIPCRLVEERLLQNGNAISLLRYLLSRDTVTHDLYLLGEDEGILQNGELQEFKPLWRAGQAEGTAGLWLPNQFLLGSRYIQGQSPSIVRRAENLDQGASIETPFGQLENTITVRMSRIRNQEQLARDWHFAPGIGLVATDKALTLKELRLGTQGIPKGAHFVPLSHHRYFPIIPGLTTRIEGVEDFLDTVVETQVLDEVKHIDLLVAGTVQSIETRVVEVREYVNGDLFELGRAYYAQCLETADVYIFGEDVQIFLENGDVVVEGDSWLAGQDDAEAGIIMPGNLTIGATHQQERVPEDSLNEVTSLSTTDSITVPVGTFTDCLRLVEHSLEFPDETPSVKVYAPGIGLVDDEGILKLTSMSGPGIDKTPMLQIETAIRVSWASTVAEYELESSFDAIQWNATPTQPRRTNTGYETFITTDSPHQFFRLGTE